MENYTGNIATTGSFQQKHIYDMAGNVWERTKEAYEFDSRVIRGGDYTNDGSNQPASCRSSSAPSSGGELIGFRLALYIQ